MFSAELSLRIKKRFPLCSYYEHEDNIASHLSDASAALDKFCTDYENIVLLGDFYVEVKVKNVSDFMSRYNLKILVKQKMCFKKPVNTLF